MSESNVYEFQIDGKVTAHRLRRALEAWTSAIFHLGREMGTDLSANNEIQNMSGGSAIAAFEVTFDDSQAADLFGQRFDSVLLAAKYQNPTILEDSPLWRPVQKMRTAARADVEDAIPGLLWRNPSGDYVINPDIDKVLATQESRIDADATEESFGVITGVLQSLSARGGFRAVVYDFVFDRAVAFSIPEQLRMDVSEKWDRPVEVSGVIRRDSVSGRPLSMFDVTDIEVTIASDDPWAWRQARGVLSHIEPTVSSETLIRRLRDE